MPEATANPGRSPIRRIALWSGPRNISTAMLRAFGNRPDTFVCDEPLYAPYLLATNKPHPGADEVMRHHETDWRKVTDWLTCFEPPGKSIFYQKHMSHHLLPGIDRGWLEGLTHAFLIRDPAEVVRSFAKVAGEPELEETGLPQQLELFRETQQRTGRTPPVIDASDVLKAPRRALVKLCEALGIAFDELMLAWPAGPRETDGIWARYWYDTVLQSTGFHAHAPRDQPVPRHLAGLLEEAEAIYQELHEHRLQ
jgi:hypothetical protein